MKSGFYMTTSDDQLSGWTKKLQSTFQSQTCTKKKGHGHCLMVCCWCDPLQLSESQQNHYTWEACSANWWDALKTAASTGQQKGSMTMPDHTSHNQCFKSWMNWATKFCLICHIHLTSCQLTTTNSNILTTFCMENAFQEFVKSWSMDFYATGINKLISC